MLAVMEAPNTHHSDAPPSMSQELRTQPIHELLSPLTISEKPEQQSTIISEEKPPTPVSPRHDSVIDDDTYRFSHLNQIPFRDPGFSDGFRCEGLQTPPSEDEPVSPTCALSPLSRSPQLCAQGLEDDLRRASAPELPPSLSGSRQSSMRYDGLSTANIRAQRRSAIRRQCSPSHGKEVRALVARMVAKGDMCDVCERRPSAPTSHPTSYPRSVPSQSPVITPNPPNDEDVVMKSVEEDPWQEPPSEDSGFGWRPDFRNDFGTNPLKRRKSSDFAHSGPVPKSAPRRDSKIQKSRFIMKKKSTFF
ncbi:MAG: hypothetical protein M1831_004543 [Alyxoria varia]|nr:MAG: hypothetical protein M1831_004543 [Alyxoria varia]